jgi:hypothetical protein
LASGLAFLFLVDFFGTSTIASEFFSFPSLSSITLALIGRGVLSPISSKDGSVTSAQSDSLKQLDSFSN